MCQWVDYIVRKTTGYLAPNDRGDALDPPNTRRRMSQIFRLSTSTHQSVKAVCVPFGNRTGSGNKLADQVRSNVSPIIYYPLCPWKPARSTDDATSPFLYSYAAASHCSLGNLSSMGPSVIILGLRKSRGGAILSSANNIESICRKSCVLFVPSWRQIQ